MTWRSLALAGALVQVEGQVQWAGSSSWTPSIRSVLMVPTSDRIHVGEQLQPQARAQDMSNGDVPFAQFVYLSSDVHIATVSDDGVISAVSPGKVTITARVGSGPRARSAAAAIEIPPAQP